MEALLTILAAKAMMNSAEHNANYANLNVKTYASNHPNTSCLGALPHRLGDDTRPVGNTKRPRTFCDSRFEFNSSAQVRRVGGLSLTFNHRDGSYLASCGRSRQHTCCVDLNAGESGNTGSQYDRKWNCFS